MQLHRQTCLELCKTRPATARIAAALGGSRGGPSTTRGRSALPIEHWKGKQTEFSGQVQLCLGLILPPPRETILRSMQASPRGELDFMQLRPCGKACGRASSIVHQDKKAFRRQI